MRVSLPRSLDEALTILKEVPGTDVLAGGTDFMVEVNYNHRRPDAVLSLRHVNELRQWHRDGAFLVLGAGLRFADIIGSELAGLAPALAQAARTVGSPQIRNTGTIGGNIATASPAGDIIPVLAALDAVVNIRSLDGGRSVTIADLITGVKRTTLADDELIVSVRIPVVAGPQEFLKVGKRNAMVIAVSNLALVADSERRTVGCALGAVGPTIIRCTAAEQFIESRIDWNGGSALGHTDSARFGELCGQAARPIDDHRSTADYRSHSIGVMAQRAITRAF